MDLGLLGGLAEGLRSGVDSYRTEREYQLKKKREADELALKKQGLESSLLERNQEVDPMTGSLRLNDLGQAQRDLALDQADETAETMDPTSERSVRARTGAKGLLNFVEPELGKRAIPEGMSAAELKDAAKEGLLGKTISGIYGMRGRELTSQRIGDSNAIKRESLNLRKDAQAQHAGDLFDKDSNIKTLMAQQQRIRNGRHTIETADTITPQLLNEIQLDIANAISGGRSAAVSTQHKTEFNSMELDWKTFMQRLTNKPQDIGSPEVKKYIVNILDRLDEAYQGNMSDRAKQIGQGRSFKYNPHAQETMENKLQGYLKKHPEDAGLLGGTSAKPGLVGAGQAQAGALTDQDKQAIEWAVQNKNDPKAKKILSIHGMQ